jgi:thiamine-phosphate pyrophosphorylase
MKPQDIDFSLYIIVDEKYISNSLAQIITDICEGGATIIQLREKTKTTKEFIEDAILVRKITEKFSIPFIVNDRVDIAIASSADGVHVGQCDMPLRYAKNILKDRIIGQSVSTIEEAIKAEKEGALYLGVGSLFPSSTKFKSTIKLEVISEIKKRIRIPVLGIGGITLDKVESILMAGADGICVANDILSSHNIRERTKKFISKIKKYKI